MHIAQQIIWREKLQEYDKIPNYAYFEEQYDEVFHLDVYFVTNDIVCMQLTCATTRDATHI